MLCFADPGVAGPVSLTFSGPAYFASEERQALTFLNPEERSLGPIT